MNEEAAEFRALREQVGLSQQDVADALNVHVRSVKRWEDPEYPFEIPDDAWDVLDAAYDLQHRQVEYAVDKAVHAAEVTRHRGELPSVRISYWRTQADYDAVHPTDSGPYGQANAASRAVAEKLRGLGFEVSFVYGSTLTPEVWESTE